MLVVQTLVFSKGCETLSPANRLARSLHPILLDRKRRQQRRFSPVKRRLSLLNSSRIFDLKKRRIGMLWTRFNPFGSSAWDQVQRMQNEMNRLFDRWGGDGAYEFPALTVREQEESLTVEAELPGMGLEDLEIFVTGNTQLTIKGERKSLHPEKGTQHRQERPFGKFVRTLTLPFPVDDSKVEARLENGILKINLPKHEAARPRKIAVKA
jgi:HSP20 family protein